MHGYKSYEEKEKFGYKGKEIKAMFEEADKEIPNISTAYETNPDAVYTSRVFTFNNLSNPVNSSMITSCYLTDEDNNKGTCIIFWNFYFIITNFVVSIEFQDSQIVDLEVSSSLQLEGIVTMYVN